MAEAQKDNKKIILDLAELSEFKDCELPIEKPRFLNGGNAIAVSNKTMNENKFFIKSTEDDWSNYDFLQLSVYSKRASGSIIPFLVRTEEESDSGYVYNITVSWSGHKIVTFPLKKGIITYNNPQNGLETVLGYSVRKYWGDMAPGETLVYIEKAWVTNSPVLDKERFIEVDKDKDYHIAGCKNQKYDAIELLKKNFPNKKHPRLILGSEDFVKLKEYIKTVPFIKNAYESVRETADKALKTSALKYELFDGMRLPRDICTDIPSLIIVYIVENDVCYKKKAWENINAVCNFPDWNPAHDLDPGDYARPIAYAYDWLYDEWSDEEKRIMRNAMLKNGVEPMITQLRKKIHYAIDKGNHNTVVTTGLGMIALAIGDENECEDIANEVINESLNALPHNLLTFAPHGVCSEGPHYWKYGQDQFFQYQAAMHKSLKTDFGLSEIPCMKTTGDYIVSMHGPTGMCFNYADGLESAHSVMSASLLWLSFLYGKPEYKEKYINSQNDSYSFLDLLFYKEDENRTDKDELSLDNFFGYVGSLLSDKKDANALYVGFKGGLQAPHMDLDFGTFVFDAYGKRWFYELAHENYDMPGMWCYGENAGRWNYYRKRAEGNNTIVINPGYNPPNTADQNPYAVCNITDTQIRPDYARVSIDLTSAYPQDAKKVIRSFSLCDNRSVFEICDDVSLNSASEFYAFMHTKAKCIVSEDKMSATLTIDNVLLKAELISDADVVFKLFDAEPLCEHFKMFPHENNSAYKKLTVYGKNLTDAKIIIRITKTE